MRAVVAAVPIVAAPPRNDRRLNALRDRIGVTGILGMAVARC